MQRRVLTIEKLLNNSKNSKTCYGALLSRISSTLILVDLLIYKKRITISQFVLLCFTNIIPKFPSILGGKLKINFVHSVLASTTNLEFLKSIEVKNSEIEIFTQSIITANPINILKIDWIRLVRFLEYFGLWEKSYQSVEQMLGTVAAKDPKIGWDITYSLFQELAIFGNYEIGELLLLKIKDLISDLDDLGVWADDGIYFSAVGHLSQFEWLVQSHLTQSNLVGASFKFGKYRLGNALLGEKWINKTQGFGWKFSKFNNLNDPFAYDDLECFPTSTGTKIMRREVGTIQKNYLASSHLPLLELTDEECSKSVSLLQDYGLPQKGNFKIIGLHVRSGMDVFALGRNSSISKYRSAAEIVAKNGDWTVGIGDEEQGRKFANLDLPNFINLAMKQSQHRDLLHLYIWAKSYFFIGNLSGGTFPASIFRTPILWTDLYPLRHFRPPNIQDLVIPKVVLHHGSGREPVSYSKVLSANNYFYNSENPFILRSRGLSLQEADGEDIENGIKEMYSQLLYKLRPNTTSKQSKLEELYKGLKLPNGAQWSPAFMERWDHLFS